MPEWLLPTILAAFGSGGLATLITAVLSGRNNTFTQMQAIVKTLQEERASDRERHNAERLEDREKLASVEAKHEALDGKVNVMSGVIDAYHEWSERVLDWGRRGGPPPEPERPAAIRPALAGSTTVAVTATAVSA